MNSIQNIKKKILLVSMIGSIMLTLQQQHTNNTQQIFEQISLNIKKRVQYKKIAKE